MKKLGILEIVRSIGSLKIKTIKFLDYFLGGFLAWIVIAKKPQYVDRPKIERLLIIRPGGIGDAVFLIPFLQKIRQFRPDIKTDILCERRNAEVFLSQKNIWFQLYCYDVFASFKKVFANHYNVIIDTEQWHYLSALLAYFLKSKQTIGFATRPLRKKFFNKTVDYSSDDDEIKSFRQLFELIVPECRDVQDINGCLKLEEEDLAWARTQIPANSICIFLGASIVIRRLAQAHLLAIAQKILALNHHVVLLGGGDVAPAGEELVRNFPGLQIHNFVGKISLRQSAALIKQSKLFIGPDSGLMHLACATGVPVIAIFGPGNLKKWRPVGAAHKIVTENVACSPCTHFGYTIPTCQGSYICVKNIKVEEILKYIPTMI